MLTPHPGVPGHLPSLGFSSQLRPCQAATPARLVQRSRNDANRRQLTAPAFGFPPNQPELIPPPAFTGKHEPSLTPPPFWNRPAPARTCLSTVNGTGLPLERGTCRCLVRQEVLG